MFKMFSVVALTASFAAPLLAQQQLASNAPLPSAPGPAVQSTVQPAVQKPVPVLSVAAGFIYLQTNITNVPSGTASYTMGWYGVPQWHLTKHWSAQGDFVNVYNFHAHQTGNTHAFLGGGSYTVQVKGLEVYPFALGGSVRNSAMSQVQWTPAAAGGIGVNLKLTKAVSFQVIPGEYVATHLPNGTWQSNYTARAGFVFTSFRKPKQTA